MKRSVIRRAATIAAAIAAVASTASARAETLPSSEPVFTAAMAQRFGTVFRDTPVSTKGPLTLMVGKGAEGLQINLDNVWSLCRREPQECEAAANDFVSKTAAFVNEMRSPVEKAALRVVVRGGQYVDSLRKMGVDHPEAAIIVRPVAGDLWLICVADGAHGVKPLNKTDVAKLGLNEDQAVALATQNTRAALTPLADKIHDLPADGLGYIAGDFYDSSRLLLHDDWADLSRKMNGHLIVAVQGNDTLVYGDGSTPIKLDALTSFVAYAAGHAQRPISTTVLHWTRAGWEIAKPD
jgi:hypothetical protein